MEGEKQREKKQREAVRKDGNHQEFNHYGSFKTHEDVSQEPVHQSHLFVIHWLCCMLAFCATNKDNTKERRVMHGICIISQCFFSPHIQFIFKISQKTISLAVNLEALETLSRLFLYSVSSTSVE